MFLSNSFNLPHAKAFSSLLILLLGLGLFSCTSMETQIQNEGRMASAILTKAPGSSVDNAKALDFVVKESDVLNYIYRHTDSPRIVSINPVKRDGDALLYVVNYADGWSLFSADKHLPPVVAENNTGAFRLGSLDNPGVLMWMDDMMDLTKRLRQETEKASANEFTDLWEGRPTTQKETGDPAKSQYTWTKVLISSTQEEIDTLTVGPFLQTEWGQKNPWNKRLPYCNGERFRTGCTAVAVSQLLFFFNDSIGIPSGLYHGITVSGYTYHNPYYTLTLTRTDYTDPSPRWAQMVLKYSDYNSADSSSVTGAGYVADLMTDVGNRVNMRYKPGRSYTLSINDALTGFSYYGLTGDTDIFRDTLAYTEIMLNHKPFYMQGYATDGGHVWVVDGMKQNRIKTTNMYMWYLGYSPGAISGGEPATQAEALEAALEAGYDHPEDMMTTYEIVYSGPYRDYHMNWGWNGDENGYYASTQAVLHDGVWYSFVTDQEILYNIRSIAK